ncbi:ORF75 [Ranid herpesvirus 2]|uniref:ORF75 n=1 Tax=Ranid herpesvirus 2 TaxID=389214 RepID=Q14W31_9VIRU|nr:ORF75 [Ranid herpesvirus 2]ABG25606.1 ORF75 [Ranid herpesvirus 2]
MRPLGIKPAPAMDLPDNHFVIGSFSSFLGTSDILLVTQHVNTVYNRHQRIKIVHKGRFKHKRIQNSTVRTTGNRFVTDKKKSFTVDGYKNTRIEFTNAEERSSNYTTNAPSVHHSLYHSFFDLLCLAHGELVEHIRPPIMNNTNYTSCIYGMTNHYMFFIRLFMTDTDFLRPLRFPSCINAVTAETRHAFFTSMYINSQRVEPYNTSRLGSYITGVECYVECDRFLSFFCSKLFLQHRTFLNTANSIAILWLNEVYHMLLPTILPDRPEADTYEWYETFMLRHYTRYANTFPGSCAQLMNQYRSIKNPTFNQCVPFILLRFAVAGWCIDKVWPVVYSYFERIKKAGQSYKDTLTEFRLIIQACVKIAASYKRMSLRDGGNTLWFDGELVLRDVGVRIRDMEDIEGPDQQLLFDGIKSHCTLVYYTVLSSDEKEAASHAGN